MELSKGEVEKATEFIKKKYQGCPNCGALNVEIHNLIALPVLAQQEASSFTIDNLSLPVLPLECSNCGHIAFFTAKKILNLE